MSIFKAATYKDISFGPFIRARDIEEKQKLANRQEYLSYDDALVDYNPLTGSMPRDFYLLPSLDYALSATDRLDNLAYKFYDDPDYWWLIAEYNRILDPFDISSYDKLKIPYKSYLFAILLDLRFGS